jgi:hypothetical protein
MSFKRTVSWEFLLFSFWQRHQYFFIDPVTKRPQFAEQVAGHHKCAEIGVKNVHILLKSQLDMANVLKKSCDKTSTVCWAGGRTSQMSKNHATKCPHFAEKLAGHCKRVGKNTVTKHPHVAKQLAGRHKWVQKFCDKLSKFCFRKGWTWCHRAFWGGWTLCHKWQTVHLEAGVDEKYMDGSYRWTNVTVVNCHSRRFVGWTLSLGWNVAWSVCGWTDHQGTHKLTCAVYALSVYKDTSKYKNVTAEKSQLEH